MVRQLCALYELERETVDSEMDAIEEWMVEGITAKMIHEWCKRKGLRGYCVWNPLCGTTILRRHAFRSWEATPTL